MTGSVPDPPRVLVWGATGFIGRALVNRLLASEIDVTVVSRGTAPPDGGLAVASWLTTAPTGGSPAFWRRALADVDVVFNLAGPSGAVASNMSPVASLDGTCRIQLAFLEGCLRSARRPHVVFASSRLVYGRTDQVVVDETTPIAPRSIYAAHKLCIEHYHQVYALRDAITFTVGRISNPFGPDLHPRRKSYGVINQLIERAARGGAMTVYGDGSQLRDYVYIDDLIEALWLCATRREAQNETFNIGRGVSLSFVDAVRSIQALTGAGIEWVPWPAETELVDSGNFLVDVSKAKSRLGFSCRYDFTAGLEATLAHRSYGRGPATPRDVAAKTQSTSAVA